MPEENAEALRKVTGWNMSLDDLLLISEKIWNLNRSHYLLRNGGPGRIHDAPPKRHVEESISSGPAKGSANTLEAFEKMLDEYYYNRGWDPKGNPTRQVLEILGLEEVADRLHQAGLLGEEFAEGIPEIRGRELKPAAMYIWSSSFNPELGLRRIFVPMWIDIHGRSPLKATHRFVNLSPISVCPPVSSHLQWLTEITSDLTIGPPMAST